MFPGAAFPFTVHTTKVRNKPSNPQETSMRSKSNCIRIGGFQGFLKLYSMQHAAISDLMKHILIE